MLSKQQAKIIQSLEKKKFRDEYHLFKAEGEKIVGELLASDLKTETVIAFPQWIATHPRLLEQVGKVIEADERDMRAVSDFQSLPPVAAIAEIPAWTCDDRIVSGGLSLVLNGVQDPGNLGTILRLADWFGVPYVFCDADTADAFAPKVVQASMGAVFRVRTVYTDLASLIDRFRTPDFRCYGTFLDGQSVYATALPAKGLIVMGNEGRGIRPELVPHIDSRITIPSFATGGQGSESLNVAVATGIILSEFRRNG